MVRRPSLKPADNSAVQGLLHRSGYSGSTLYDGWNDTGATNAPLARNATARLAGASG